MTYHNVVSIYGLVLVTSACIVCILVDIHAYIAESESTGRWKQDPRFIVEQVLRAGHRGNLDRFNACEYNS